MQHLAAQQGVTQVLLMGHSTGCQDAVRYVQRYGSQDTQQQQGRRLPQLVGVVLQAPVSARGDGHCWQLWDVEGDKAGPRRRTASAHFSTESMPHNHHISTYTPCPQSVHTMACTLPRGVRMPYRLSLFCSAGERQRVVGHVCRPAGPTGS
jgi:pimeloyl-ACP methyl ester carboxylesterase